MFQGLKPIFAEMVKKALKQPNNQESKSFQLRDFGFSILLSFTSFEQYNH